MLQDEEEDENEEEDEKGEQEEEHNEQGGTRRKNLPMVDWKWNSKRKRRMIRWMLPL